MEKPGEVYVGTSGWQYKHWKGNFYPLDLSQKQWLNYYSRIFKTVEVNSSFYRQITRDIFRKWTNETPKDFLFSVKANRYITHIKRLKSVNDAVKRFFENAKVLGRNSDYKKHALKHVILWQFPPNLKKDSRRFRDFLEVLPKDFRHAFEFRHKSWGDGEIIEIIENSKLNLTMVIQDWIEWLILENPVGNFVYIRFHGESKLYSSSYSNDELAKWAGKMQKWLSLGKDIYAYFNNDALGHAPQNALFLKKFMSRIIKSEVVVD